MREQRGNLIADQEAIVAFAVGLSASQTADPVGIGIGGDDELSMGLARHFLSSIHELRPFRIGSFGDGEKLTVGRGLFGHRDGAEALGYQYLTRAEKTFAAERRKKHANFIQFWGRNKAL